MSAKPGESWGRAELESRLRRLQEQIEDYRRRNGELRLAIETLTAIDPVSGVRNRLGILQSIEGGLQWNSREGQPFGVLSIRIPALARLRESETDEVVDEALAHVAALISAGLRDVDRVGRWNEEVFVVVLPKFDESGVVPVATRIASMLSAVPMHGEVADYDLKPRLAVLLVGPNSTVKQEVVADAIDSVIGSDDSSNPKIVHLGV